MKLIERPKKSLYEVDIEFMIGDADGEEHYVVPIYDLDEVKELVKELNRYFNETTWNQRCDPKPTQVFAEYPILMKHLCYLGDNDEYTLEQISQGYGEIYWPIDLLTYDHYLHLVGYEVFHNTEDNRYEVEFEEGDL